MKAISLRELKKQYQGSDAIFYQIKSKKEALRQINSKTSCCWGAGQKFEGTGWTVLASPSAGSRGSKRTIFVCKDELLEIKGLI